MSRTSWNAATFSLLSCLMGFGCGTTQPPQELLGARAAYQRAETSKAPQFDPASLHAAKVDLDKAEQAFADDGDSAHVRDLSYVAMRKSEMAQVNGNIVSQQRQLK